MTLLYYIYAKRMLPILLFPTGPQETQEMHDLTDMLSVDHACTKRTWANKCSMLSGEKKREGVVEDERQIFGQIIYTKIWG